ncbi:MAG: hypothetical protein NW202_08430 [Nitrospira sp.]|nr:hypothetical protein [Nitrospira sp.]
MKVAFFAPHSAVWVHAFPEALVAEALTQGGHEVLYLTCGRVFHRHCVAMSAVGYAFDVASNLKERACQSCDLNKSIVRREFGFKGFDIASVLSLEDQARADGLLAALTPENFLKAQFHEIEYGRAALSSFLLVYKKVTLQFSAREWQILLVEIRHALLSLMAAVKVFDSEKPDRLVLYSPGYSVNLVWAKLAQRLGIPQYYIQGANNLSDRLQKLIFARGLFWQGLTIKQWDRFKALPCSAPAARYVTEHFLELFRGRSLLTYSLGRMGDGVDVRARFGVRPDQKFMVATMSSYDELFAGEITGQMPSLDRGAFPTQIEWIRSLVEFVKSRDDLFLLIRVHPREFPNRREGLKSEHAVQLEEQFSRLPPNARVNWPSDGVSLYDLAEEMDVCLNAWSNAGKEMTFLGIPVVLYSTQTIFYHPAINYAADTTAEYFRLIDTALTDGWRFENTKVAFRWYALDDLYSRIDISESFPFYELRHPPKPVRAILRLIRFFYPGFQQVRDCRKRVPSLRMAPLVTKVIESGSNSLLDILGPQDFSSTTAEQEDQAIRAELLRFAQSLYGPEFERPGGKLKRNVLRVVEASPLVLQMAHTSGT